MIKKGARSEDVVLRGKVSQPLLDLEDRFESALLTRSLKEDRFLNLDEVRERLEL